MSAPLREAASVILLRPTEAGTEAGTEPGFEVFLLRRHRQAKFMASAFVFPGGATEPGEDARTAAAREEILRRYVAIVARGRQAFRMLHQNQAAAHSLAAAKGGLLWLRYPLSGVLGEGIADPDDAGMLDVVGFDTASPAVISDFVRPRAAEDGAG